jgi:hypothetical protein
MNFSRNTPSFTVYVCSWAYRPFLDGDPEANNGKAAVAVQRRGKHASATIGLLLGKHVPAARGKRGVVYAVRARSYKKKRFGETSSVELCKGGREEMAPQFSSIVHS